MNEEKKRLFFALNISAPWPIRYPPGRVLEEKDRHLTLAFLGSVDLSKVQKFLPSFPKIPLKTGFVGEFVKCLFLPVRNPRVAAWEIEWYNNHAHFLSYQKEIEQWLEKNQLPFVKRKGQKEEFLPHVTICRQPSALHEWQKSFSPLPIIANGIHLFESLGHSQYTSLWRQDFILPFEEIEHTADIAFKVRGEDFAQLYLHAQIALAFKFPVFLSYYSTAFVSNIDDVIMNLNEIVGKIDAAEGSPIKAVSFHAEIIKRNELLEWEMIVDV